MDKPWKSIALKPETYTRPFKKIRKYISYSRNEKEWILNE